jgi:hypothetical protein
VTDVAKFVVFGDLGGPPLDGGVLDLDGTPAGTAHQVMMVVRAAPPVHLFTGSGANAIGNALVGEYL